MRKVRVLIADDMEIIANQTKSCLEKREDVEIVGIAYNGEEELNMINELSPDLVFTDNQMPKKNGIEVIESVYNSTMEKKPEFVFVTGDRDMVLFQRANECEVIRILNKPIEENKIIDAFELYKEISETPKVIKQENTEEIKQEKKSSFLDKVKKIFK